MSVYSHYLLIAVLLGFVVILIASIVIVARKGMREQQRPRHDKLSDHLQWGALIAPGTIMNKNRTLMKTVAFRGPDLAASSQEEMLVMTAKVNNALKRLGSGWTYFIEAQRFEQNDYPKSHWSNAASWLVDQERHGTFSDTHHHFESSYYLTLVWALPQPISKKLENLFYDDPERGKINKDFERNLDYFTRTTHEAFAILDTIFPSMGILDDHQLLAYLHSTLSPDTQPVNVPDLPMYLDAYLADKPFYTGEVAVIGDYYMPTLSITGLPHSTVPGILDQLNHLNLEYRWVSRFICLDKEPAMHEIMAKRRYWTGKVKGIWTMLKETAAGEPSRLINTDAQNQADDADTAAQELGADFVAYGHYSSIITVWDKHLETAQAKAHEIKQVLNAHGFMVRDERLYAFDVWKSSLPGEITANVRRPLINTINLAHIMPISSIWAGDVENAHLKAISGEGNPHVMCSTTGATPFRLNLNVADVGHTVVIGPTGAGKSLFLNLLALQWMKYPGAQVFIFDKDRSARAATMAVGGKYYEPGNDDKGIAFQPLAHIDLKPERLWALQYICDILQAQHLTLTPAITHEIETALIALSDSPKHQRTMTGLHALCQDNTIREALYLYTLSGPYGQLFDADRDDIQQVDWLMFEMGQVMTMGEQVVVPTLMYLFHRLELLCTGRPSLLILDESWLFLNHPEFAERLKGWLKTLRKKNVYVVFATQEPADAASSSISSTIIAACPTRIFLPDEEALIPDVARHYKAFGLSDTELHILATAQKKRDYYYRSVKGRRLFNLDIAPATLAFTGMSSPDDHQLLDTIEQAYPAEAWAAAILEKQGLTWAHGLIEGETAWQTAA